MYKFWYVMSKALLGKLYTLNAEGSCCTQKCLSIGTLKTINFPFVPNGKFMFFKCPNIQAYYNLAVMCQILGHLKIINLPF